jgi:dienelactone hydrolase
MRSFNACRRVRSNPSTAWLLFGALLLFPVLGEAPAAAQALGEADRGEPGDAMIQEYLRQETVKIEREFPGGIKSGEEWNQARSRFRQEYFHMLGLWPLPERTPLRATVTRTLDRGDYVVDMVHYQSRPGLYVTGNLYRPAKVAPGERLPAILYVCGHSPRPRNGNKTAYQSHGIWFARHGYVCLMVDTLEMGELTCTHHGTYRDGRWWWLSRGYTPAGVECWNGVRGIDYLVSRPDVDPERIGVTGISGGGAATFWISAADERVKAAVPVSGLSDLLAHVPNRVVNGHCDCMFHYNTYQWPFAKVAGMIAPRPLLFVNSDADEIFPMDGNERLINRLERLYSLLGAGDDLDSVVSVGGHAYRQDIRRAAFRFLNTHLKNDPRPIADSEVDLVTSAPKETHPIPPEQLRVFPQDSDFPQDARNGRIDYEFVPMAKAQLPGAGRFDAWKSELMTGLKEVTFHHFPTIIPAAVAADTKSSGVVQLSTEPAISIRFRQVRAPGGNSGRTWLLVASSGLEEVLPSWLTARVGSRDAVYVCEPRGIGGTKWTTKNPPNYVERSHYLLGRTVDSGRVWDIAATAGYLRAIQLPQTELFVAGEGATAVLCAYAALLEPGISGLVLSKPPGSHMDPTAPALLNVLRVCDVGEAIGLVAPRPAALLGAAPELVERVVAYYRSAGTLDNLSSDAK